MSPLAQATLALLLGAAGVYAAARLHLPAHGIIGPMLLIGVASCLGFVTPQPPPWFRLALQIVIGTFIGLRIDRRALAGSRLLLRPIALATLWLFVSAFVIGCLLAWASGADLATALLGAAPAGIVEMSAMAVSLDANVALVATLQTLRIFATMLIFPLCVRRGLAEQPLTAAPPLALPADPVASKPHSWLVCLAVATTGGIVLDRLGVPVAGIIGSTVTVAALQTSGLRFEPPPLSLRTAAQAGLGILIGATLNREMVRQLGSQFLPIVLTTAATVASSLALARVVQAWLGNDAQTALLACAPAGVTQMAAIAEDLGAQVFVVSLFQLVRLLSVVMTVPLSLQLLL